MNKHRYLFLILIGYGFTGCSVKTEKNYYPNGSIREVIEIVDGKKNGLYKAYYPNGQLGATCYYENNKKEGIASSYDENGVCKITYWYENDIPNGVFKTYFPNQHIYTTGFFVNKKKEGIVIYYYSNGKIDQLAHYKNDQYDGEVWTNYIDGSLASYTIFKDGIKEYSKQYDSISHGLKSIFRNISIECRDTLKEGDKFEARLRLFGPLDSTQRIFKTLISYYGEEERKKNLINTLPQEVPFKFKDSLMFTSPPLLPGKHGLIVIFNTIEKSIHTEYQGNFDFFVLPADSQRRSSRIYNKFISLEINRLLPWTDQRVK